MSEKFEQLPDFQVDVILEEAQLKKTERLKQPLLEKPLLKQEKTEPQVSLGALLPKKEEIKKPQEQVSDISDTIIPDKKNIQDTVEKKHIKNIDVATRAFTIKNPSHEQDKMSDDGIEEEVKVFVPKNSDNPVNKVEMNNDRTAGTEESDGLDQIQLDSLIEGISEEEAPQPEDWEDRLQRERRKKAENFKLHPPVALRLSGEEEDNDPSEEPETFEDEEIEDFGSYDDADAVRNELVYRRRTGWIQVILTGTFALTLVGTSILYSLSWTNINPVLYVGLNVFLLSAAALINHRSVGEGMSSLFHLRAGIDSMMAVIVVLTVIHTLLQFLNPEVITGDKDIILAPAAVVALFFSALGRQMLVLRINDNFKFVSYRGEKYAARLIESRKTAEEIGRAAVAIGEPEVCYLEKTDFLTRFLENSYEVNPGERSMSIYVPCAIGASAILAAVFGIFSSSVMNGFTVFVSSVFISAPIGAMTAVNFPILRAAKKILRHGAMLIGWQAAEEFGNIHALAVDALEVFPSESVLLHGIKTFSGARIDEAILDAAAVSIAAGGPLSSVFRRVVQNRTDILKEVDTLVYEHEMGMSGWVGGRRVLIGNRRLLENHGVDVPSRDYEARYTKNDRQVVFLSTAGELSAMFVVSYVADEGIEKALKSLCRSGITLLVKTCDPNVTEELICRTYDLDPYYVEVMSAPAGRSYDQLLTQKSEETEAVFASNGRLEGTAYGVTYCYRLFNAVRLALVLLVIGGIIGFSLLVFTTLYAGEMMPPLILIAYSLLWILISWLIPCINCV
ncbi:MAG: hypothetical protein PHH84_01665 [Oscillospiraceae bacterium]|nr:hypothetical protein [Oscillospiraceae bacterium]MDD4414433.1 hypothetical protein [Oscillospiraceae bacterium]